jgi:hypothetical protein
MATFSLRHAAQQAGTSKSTILRAIQSGRLSASRLEDGGYSIDPAELTRVYPPRSSIVAADQSADRSVGQDTTPRGTDSATELRIRNATLEAELGVMCQLLEAEKRRAEELREDRDRWHAQAERLALPAPETAAMPKHWWQRKVG